MACNAPPPAPTDAWQRDPEAAALEVVAVARDVDARSDRIAALFDRQDDPVRNAALLDALSAMGDLGETRVLRVERLDAVGRFAVDLVGDLVGGGAAEWTLQFAEREDGTLQAVWFAGPDVEWPARPRRDSGLTSSPPS